MIERIIENWLTNTNERFIRTAFCQLLINEGHDIKDIHGNLEHGKDIISIDSTGTYNAYQLKKGNIDTDIWRDIEPQINELIEYPIDHVGFDIEKKHTPYLVISGTVNSITVDAIRLYNKSKIQRDFPTLEIIDKNQLVRRFKEAQSKIIPKEFEDFYTFLDILTIDGKDFLPKKIIFDFLEKVIFNEIPHHRYDRINNISSSLIFMSYLLERYQQVNNYFALFEAWIILAGCIIRFGIKANLKFEDFESSLDLVFENIIETLNLLKNEILTKKDFFEGVYNFDSSKTYGSRVVMVLGTVACLELYNSQIIEDYEQEKDFLDLIKEKIQFAIFWGESAFPFYFYIIRYLELNNEKDLANQLLEEILGNITEKNHNSKKGLPNVYYEVNKVIESLVREDMEEYVKNAQIENFLKEKTQLKINKSFLIPNFPINLQYGIEDYLKNQTNFIKIIFAMNDKNLNELSFENTIPNNLSLIMALQKILKYSNLEKIDYRNFPGSSYVLESIVLMLARRGNRQILADNWRKVSHIKFDRFEINNIEDTFTWKTNGSNKIIVPNEQQSWKELVDIANQNGDIPEFYQDFFVILQFFILAVPHRINSDLIGFLDSNC